MDFNGVYCNNCFAKKLEQPNLLFHISQCSHIFCSSCVDSARQSCLRCGAKNVATLPLQEPLDPQIAYLYTPTAELVNQYLSARKFQDAQAAVCARYESRLRKKYNQLKEAYQAACKRFKETDEKSRKLKKFIAAMDEKMREMSKEIEAGRDRVKQMSEFKVPLAAPGSGSSYNSSSQSTPLFKTPVGCSSSRSYASSKQPSPTFTVSSTASYRHSHNSPRLNQSDSVFKMPISRTPSPIYRTPSPSDISMRKLCLNTPSMTTPRPTFATNRSAHCPSRDSRHFSSPSVYATPCSQIRSASRPIHCPSIQRSRPMSQGRFRAEDKFVTPDSHFRP